LGDRKDIWLIKKLAPLFPKATVSLTDCGRRNPRDKWLTKVHLENSSNTEVTAIFWAFLVCYRTAIVETAVEQVQGHSLLTNISHLAEGFIELHWELSK